MILAGDIGGTKTLLALYNSSGTEKIYQQRYASGAHPNFEELLHHFLNAAGSQSHGTLTAAGFGIAGPITGEPGNQRVHATNLPWKMESAALSAQLNNAPVLFANDLVASGTAAINSSPQQRISLNAPQKGSDQSTRHHIAIIAAGTGLGEALFYADGQRHHPIPTEGGHSSFAPNNSVEDQLLIYMRQQTGGHVSYERILSGRGFLHLYNFAREHGLANETAEMAAELASADDPSAAITKHGCAGSDALSVITCQLFARIYGAEAGNLALKSLPFGGLFIAGAIAGYILPFLQSEFMGDFLDKGRFRELLSQIPVWVVNDPELALQGAAQLAVELGRG